MCRLLSKHRARQTLINPQIIGQLTEPKVSQNRSARSQKPEEHYHLSLKIKSADDTLPLDETRRPIQFAQQLLKSPKRLSPSASSSDTFPSSGSDDFLRKIKLEWTISLQILCLVTRRSIVERPIKTAESFDLGRLTGAYSHVDAVYVDSIPAYTTTVTTCLQVRQTYFDPRPTK